MSYPRGCLSAVSIVFMLSLACLILSGLLKADASRARSQAFTSMHAAVDRLYSSDDPDYQRRYAAEIQAERMRRAGSIGRQYRDAMTWVIFTAVIGWAGVLTAIIMFVVIRRRAEEKKEMAECGICEDNWASSGYSHDPHRRGKYHVRIIDDGGLPDPEIIRRNRVIAAVFILLLIGIPLLIAIGN